MIMLEVMLAAVGPVTIEIEQMDEETGYKQHREILILAYLLFCLRFYFWIPRKKQKSLE
jgi:hypothetical protein